MHVNFTDFIATVDSLATLPELKSLYINMTEEDQVDLIMKKLPVLEFLNGLPVDREGLEED